MTEYYYIDYFDEKTMKQKLINEVKKQAMRDQFIEKDFLAIATDPSKLSYRVVLNGILTFSVSVNLSINWHAVKHELFEKPDRWGGTESGIYRSQVYLLDQGLKGEYKPYNTDGTFYTDKYKKEKPAYVTGEIKEVNGFSQSMEKAILSNTHSFKEQAMSSVYRRYSDYTVTTEFPRVSLNSTPSLFSADRYISPTYEISFTYNGKKISAWFNKEGELINKIDYPIQREEAERRRIAEETRKREEEEKKKKQEKEALMLILPGLLALYTLLPIIIIIVREGFGIGLCAAGAAVVGTIIAFWLNFRINKWLIGGIITTIIMLIVSVGMSILAFSPMF